MNYQEILEKLGQININNPFLSQFVKDYVAFCDWWAFFYIFWASAFACLVFYFAAYFNHIKESYEIEKNYYYILSSGLWFLALLMSYVNAERFHHHITMATVANKDIRLHLKKHVIPKLNNKDWPALVESLHSGKPLRNINAFKEINSMSFYAWSIPLFTLVVVSLVSWFQVRKNQIYEGLGKPNEIPGDLKWSIVTNITTIHVMELAQLTLVWLLSVFVMSLLLSWLYPDAALLYYLSESKAG